MEIEVLSTGAGCSLQDGGRAGWRRYGVPGGGAMDRHAMRAANRLLGNKPDAPVLEILLQGARLKVRGGGWLALAGGDFCPALEAWSAREFSDGEELVFSKRGNGLWAYLAVPGGFDSGRWFGSASVDPRNGLGEALVKGSVICSGQEMPVVSTDGIGRRMLMVEERRAYPQEEGFELLPGPQFDSFSGEAREQLVTGEWLVSARSDRTGYRLEGAALEVPESIASEPVLPGSFQVPGNGMPIITMVDGPTVGGYPKIAVLRDEDRDRLAQCAPGTQLNFRWADS